MSLKGIKSILEKIKNITPPEVYARTYIQEEIKKETGIDIDIKKIKYSSKEGRATLKTSSSEKNFIFLKKKNILNNLKNKMGQKSPKDIL